MAKEQFDIEDDDEQAGAPEWMVTFSDCMTLLLTFFVLLLSFSTFDPKKVASMADSFANSMPTVGISFTSPTDSIFKNQKSRNAKSMEQGSETKTNQKDETNNFIKEKRPLDFKNLKVFRIESEKFFLGRGTVLSKLARDMLEKLAFFIKESPTRVVVSEHGPDGADLLGAERAYNMMDFLASEGKVEKDLLSVSTANMMRNRKSPSRMVEITLLEDVVY